MYSDNGIDTLLARLLPDRGMAVDVGANLSHGSNTLVLEEQGWTVLCIEPNPLLEAEGRMLRRLWRSVACGAKDAEKQTFYSCAGPCHASNSGLVERDGVKDVFQVSVRRLDRVLDEAGFTRLDLVTIDVEGYECQVLAGFTVDRWWPQVMVVETWLDDMDPPAGYTRHCRMDFDNVFVLDGSHAAKMASMENTNE